MQHYPFPSGVPLLLEHSAFSFLLHIARRGEVGTRIDKYRPLIMPPRFVRQLRNNTAQSLVLFVLLGAYLLAAVAARVPFSNMYIPLISTLRIGFCFGCGCPTKSKHQADNLAKLRQEFLPVRELIAKIFGAVSRTISLMRLSALLASKRCRCRNDGFCSGARATIINY